MHDACLWHGIQTALAALCACAGQKHMNNCQMFAYGLVAKLGTGFNANLWASHTDTAQAAPTFTALSTAVLLACQATRMNTLLVELKRSMEELQLGLDGALNMSDKMEALARGIATNTVSCLQAAPSCATFSAIELLLRDSQSIDNTLCFCSMGGPSHPVMLVS